MKFLFITALLATGCLTVFAQETPIPRDSTQDKSQANTAASLTPGITPQSPNVAALGRFGEHPVSLFTGLPAIDVPIYDIVAGGVRVPVKLAYHAGGRRVTDLASWVGYGWALQAGGVISRQLIGKPDEDGILNAPLNTTINVNEVNETNCLQNYTDLLAYVDNTRDGSYDIFSFSLPGGKSGKFILVPDAASGSMATMMPYSRMQIQFTRTATSGPGSSSYISAFVVTDEDGTIYTFDQRESIAVSSNGTAQSNYTNNWQLSAIRGLGPQDEVRFVYAASPDYGATFDISYAQVVIDEIAISSGGDCSVSPGVKGQTPTDLTGTFTTRILQEIRFPAGKLTFGTGSRTDISQSRLLDNVQLWGWNVVQNTYQLIKTFDLQHGYFTAAANSSFAPLRLDGVQLKDQTNAVIGSYGFSYNTSVAMPANGSTSRDVWGYFNAKRNVSALDNSAFTLIPKQPAILSDGTSVTVGGADRSTDETAMQAWMLTQINYPTGGYSRFFYEANRYLDGTVQLSGGLRITRLETQASATAPVQTKTYRYGTGQSGYGRANGSFSNANSLRQGLWFSEYKTRYSPTSLCISYRTRVFGSNYTGNLNPFDGSPVTYSEVTEYDGTPTANNGYTVYGYKDSPIDNLKVLGSNPNRNFVESYYWNRGQLISKRVYTSGGSLLAQTLNTYRDDYAPISIANIGILTAHANLYPNQRHYYQNQCGVLREEFNNPVYYSWITGLIRQVRSETYSYPSDGSTGYTYQKQETDYSPTFYLPTETRTTAEGNIVLGTRLSYPQNFTRAVPANADADLLGIKTLQARNAYLPVETINFRDDTDGRRYKTGKLTTYNSLTINSLATALPRQVYLPDTDFNNKAYQPGSTTSPYQPSADWYNSQTATTGTDFPTDRIWQLRLTMTGYDLTGNLTGYGLTAGVANTMSYGTFAPVGGVCFSVLASETRNAGQPSAQTSVFSYQVPLLGVADMFTPNNLKTSYEYDAFGRLARIKDNSGNVLKQFTYRYGTAP